jgi:hypothetical protein
VYVCACTCACVCAAVCALSHQTIVDLLLGPAQDMEARSDHARGSHGRASAIERESVLGCAGCAVSVFENATHPRGLMAQSAISDSIHLLPS